MAAILHDIGIKEAEAKYNSADGYYQEVLGPKTARSIMGECGVEQYYCERVCYLVGHHHTGKRLLENMYGV